MGNYKSKDELTEQDVLFLQYDLEEAQDLISEIGQAQLSYFGFLGWLLGGWTVVSPLQDRRIQLIRGKRIERLDKERQKGA